MNQEFSTIINALKIVIKYIFIAISILVITAAVIYAFIYLGGGGLQQIKK
jgi:hypothetical protein